jgi:5-methyltetrahydrofolate--homocysteine methyltransferase
VIGSIQGDRHTLPTAIMSDLLRGAGLEVVDLGADCPPSSVLETAAALDGPSVVGICITASEGLDEAPAYLAALRAGGLGCPIVLGGGAVTDAALAHRLGAEHWAGDPEGAVTLFVELAGHRGPDAGAERSADARGSDE